MADGALMGVQNVVLPRGRAGAAMLLKAKQNKPHPITAALEVGRRALMQVEKEQLLALGERFALLPTNPKDGKRNP